MRQSSDKVLLERADKQFGVLKDVHLAEAGMAPSTTSRWVRTGQLTRLHPRIYAWGHAALLREGTWLAAQWACGDDAVVSHTSAIARHGYLVEAHDDPVHVTTTGQARSREGIIVHRVKRLDERRDTFASSLLQFTTLPRTLVDIADVLPWDEYRAVADRVHELRLDRVAAAQSRAPNRTGAPLVTRLLEADDAHTKSEFERRFLRFSVRHSLPRPDRLNRRLAGHRADCIYEDARLVIELDGRAYHKRRSQMRKDRLRDGDYQVAGYRILRLVWDDLHRDEQRRTAERVRQMHAPA